MSRPRFSRGFCFQSHQRGGGTDAHAGHVICGPATNSKQDNLTNCIMHYILLMSSGSCIRKWPGSGSNDVHYSSDPGRDGRPCFIFCHRATSQHNVSVSLCPIPTCLPSDLKPAHAVIQHNSSLCTSSAPLKCPNSSSGGGGGQKKAD